MAKDQSMIDKRKHEYRVYGALFLLVGILAAIGTGLIAIYGPMLAPLFLAGSAAVDLALWVTAIGLLVRFNSIPSKIRHWEEYKKLNQGFADQARAREQE